MSSTPANHYEPVLTGASWNRRVSNGSELPRHKGLVGRSMKRFVLLLSITILSASGFLGWKFYQNASKLTGNRNPLALAAAFTPSTLKESNGRVNVLLAGYSADDTGHTGAELTDSVMILSVDPIDKTAVVISVPRDLYVNIPGYGYSKINAAYEYGESENFSANGYASGGMGLLEDTLNQDFGVQFDYEALINYTAFKDAVDAIGGVTVTINSSDPRGLYDPNTDLNLPNGTVTLNGTQALNLARARGDGTGSYGFTNGDFDRTTNQQLLLLTLKDKLSSTSVIANPLKIASLADAVGDNVKTDMSLGVMETLYSKIKGISDSNITTVTLNNYNGQNYLQDYRTASGAEALIPAVGIDNYSALQLLVTNLLSTNTAHS